MPNGNFHILFFSSACATAHHQRHITRVCHACMHNKSSCRIIYMKFTPKYFTFNTHCSCYAVPHNSCIRSHYFFSIALCVFFLYASIFNYSHVISTVHENRARSMNIKPWHLAISPLAESLLPSNLTSMRCGQRRALVALRRKLHDSSLALCQSTHSLRWKISYALAKFNWKLCPIMKKRTINFWHLASPYAEWIKTWINHANPLIIAYSLHPHI